MTERELLANLREIVSQYVELNYSCLVTVGIVTNQSTVLSNLPGTYSEPGKIVCAVQLGIRYDHHNTKRSNRKTPCDRTTQFNEFIKTL